MSSTYKAALLDLSMCLNVLHEDNDTEFDSNSCSKKHTVLICSTYCEPCEIMSSIAFVFWGVIYVLSIIAQQQCNSMA